jgi:hypothetical protein
MSRAALDRSARVQFAAALALGLVLFGVGLYMWRRPHTPVDASAADAEPSGSSAMADAAPAPVASVAPPSPVTLTDAHVLGCHDLGPKKTAPDQCDHVASIEKALSDAVEETAACVPPSASGGTIEYIADVSFLRHKLNVILPAAGRSVRDRKVLHACASAVRSVLRRTPIDGVDHQHARYEISVTATYRGASRGG